MTPIAMAMPCNPPLIAQCRSRTVHVPFHENESSEWRAPLQVKGLFGRAKRVTEEAVEEPQKAASGLFGRAKRTAEEAAEEPQKKAGSLFEGTKKVVAKVEQGAKQAQNNVASSAKRTAAQAKSGAAEDAPPSTRGGLFGKKAQNEAEAASKQVRISAQLFNFDVYLPSP